MKLTDSRVTGIGSLPHHNVDAALDFSFKMGLPFLPQIPIRNSWEYMLSQALEGLPGIRLDSDASISLMIEVWEGQSANLGRQLNQAFRRSAEDPLAFEAFEPQASTSSCWQPFLWELQERNYSFAKIQLAGPLTCQWALRVLSKKYALTAIDLSAELSTQVFQLLLARSIAMVRRMKSIQIQPVFFIDEPGLSVLNLSNPKHVLLIQELKIFIQTLKKEGAIIGLHCCGNTVWETVFQLGCDIVSLDTSLSLDSAVQSEGGRSFKNFVQQGGTLSFGIIPTGRASALQSLNSKQLVHELRTSLNQAWPSEKERVDQVMKQALYTPACGLALQSISEAEFILDKLLETYHCVHSE